MPFEYLHITSAPIGEGRERICYVHPEDERKLVKVQKGDIDKQTRRELALYRFLQRRKHADYSQIPRFYGRVRTNLGPGFVVDLIRDFDGGISKPLGWFFEQGYPVQEFMPYLEELKAYLMDNQIVINVDLTRSNVLFQKLSPEKACLVAIDGIGNHSAINWFDGFRSVSDGKISRRWERFMKQLVARSEQTIRNINAAPKPLEAAYRRPG